MANLEHLAILKQGVPTWNAWRAGNSHVKPDLSEVDLAKTLLRGIDLRKAKLTHTNLTQAHLSEANLSGADLTESDLYETNLVSADLTKGILRSAKLHRADLTQANLTQANLTRSIFYDADLSRAILQGAILGSTSVEDTNLPQANLSEANLRGVDFTRANLTQTNFSRSKITQVNFSGATITQVNMMGAMIGWTIFGNVDLREISGLDTISHTGPSIIGIDTFYHSHGDIPESFLRGCGVPDSMIEYARSLVAAERPIDYYSVFISYSSHDEALAERLYADLQAKGVRCWYAPYDLEIGAPILSGIDQAIRIHDKVLLLLSAASVESGWVEKEVQMAIAREATERRRVLFPIRIDDTVLKSRPGWPTTVWDTINIGDFRQWKAHDSYQEAFQRLLRDLKAEQR